LIPIKELSSQRRLLSHLNILATTPATAAIRWVRPASVVCPCHISRDLCLLLCRMVPHTEAVHLQALVLPLPWDLGGPPPQCATSALHGAVRAERMAGDDQQGGADQGGADHC
jgi:hypothetical protein